MSLEDKIKNAKPTTWLTEGLSKPYVWLIVKWAKLKAKLFKGEHR